MTDHVAVGLDGSAESTAAAQWAAGEALLRGVPLEIVHVEEWLEHPPHTASTGEITRRWADALLEETAGALLALHPGLEITTHRRGGLPPEALARAADTSSMLVLGSRGLGGMAGFVMGSVASGTVARARRPVVLVRASADAPADGAVITADGAVVAADSAVIAADGAVVAGVDARRPCGELLGFAFDAASRRGHRLRVVHAWTPPPVLSYAPDLDPALLQEMSRAVAVALDDMVAPWCDKYPAVEVDRSTPVGQAAVHVLEAAHDSALVVIGRRIRSSAFGAHIGSVAHAVVHHCTVPVAVVAHD
ncbi:universal stress protein [Streptomyces sp. NPDC058289]|uniref:universal stress protein n=1 Tax=Streptomyces sp. NPDC058289 TaxID=3346425 RepID=UPI0036E982C2